MRIETSVVSLNSSHQRLTRDERQESLRIWRGNPRPDIEGLARTSRNEVSLSQAARIQFAMEVPVARSLRQTTDSSSNPIEAGVKAAENDPFLSLIRSMIEALTGHALKSLSTGGLQQPVASLERPTQAPVAPVRIATEATQVGYGIEYDASSVHEEYEQTRFTAEGMVVTADGQEIRFSLELEMERYYREETHVSFRDGDAQRKDPLVVNFNGNAAQLVDQHFRFDLDADGQLEKLALLASGSGFLAFDRNENGRIDNGTELFGPATNHGFTELAKLDSNSNGWLDEDDTLFNALKIWRPAQDGPGLLTTLADEHVGAIGLTDVATPFELRGNHNGDLGKIRSSGIYLDPNGQAGSVQEIDLTV